MTEAEEPRDDPGCFMTVDCDDFWLDGPGDHTVRPIPPHRLAQAKALRDLIVASEAEERSKAAEKTPKN